MRNEISRFFAKGLLSPNELKHILGGYVQDETAECTASCPEGTVTVYDDEASKCKNYDGEKTCGSIALLYIPKGGSAWTEKYCNPCTS